MASNLSAPPVLSTPDTHILSEVEPVHFVERSQLLSDEQLFLRYEIARTIEEIRRNRWKRIALQFPDQMLPDSARVYQVLNRELGGTSHNDSSIATAKSPGDGTSRPTQELSDTESKQPVKLTILGDTSYGSCCVDEIAAEHVDADAVVHYGRACLSPTARLPVMHIFTTQDLDRNAVCQVFKDIFVSKDAKVVVTADTSYATHVEDVVTGLKHLGYTDLFAASLVHDPSSLIPNRTLPESVGQDPSTLKDWSLFHISDPPTSLLLTLSSRMKNVHIYNTSSEDDSGRLSHQANTAIILRRRYALITSLSTVAIWGILINTLSVKNYLHVVEHIRKEIDRAGKKSYLFVVGKLNAAKVANFAEIGGWVVIGCWESSLIDSRDFYKPIITPFELDLVLAGDENRIWTGEWRSDFQSVLDHHEEDGTEDEQQYQHQHKHQRTSRMPGAFEDDEDELAEKDDIDGPDSEEESAPPEYDLRTGRYVSQSRPMGEQQAVRQTRKDKSRNATSSTLIKRSNGDILAVKGIASPAAQFLAHKRTWRGLGSDFEIRYEDEEEDHGGLVEEGRTGIARAYTVGNSTQS